LEKNVHISPPSSSKEMGWGELSPEGAKYNSTGQSPVKINPHHFKPCDTYKEKNRKLKMKS